jgi:hypothetical protein
LELLRGREGSDASADELLLRLIILIFFKQ